MRISACIGALQLLWRCSNVPGNGVACAITLVPPQLGELTDLEIQWRKHIQREGLLRAATHRAVHSSTGKPLLTVENCMRVMRNGADAKVNSRSRET